MQGATALKNQAKLGPSADGVSNDLHCGCRLSTVPAELLRGCAKLASLLLHDNPITTAQLRGLEGYVDYDERRRRKYDKQVGQSIAAKGSASQTLTTLL